MAFPRRILLKAAALGLAASGCGVVGFDVEQDIPEQTVQGLGLGIALPVNFLQFPLQIDIDSQTKAMGTGPASSAHLKSITLTITKPPGETFDFVDSIVINIAGEGLPTREVARLDPVPATGTISLQVIESVDLLPYIKKGASLSSNAKGHTPAQTISFNGKVVVRVKV